MIDMFTFYFFVSFLFILIYVLIKTNNKENFETIRNYLNSLLVNNFYFEIFMVILYFFFYFFLLFIIRLKFLNNLQGNYFFFPELSVNLFYFFFSIIFYYKIIDILFYKNMLRVHIYFSKYELYNKFSHFILNNSNFISTKISNFCFKCKLYTLSEKDFIDSLKLGYYLKNSDKYESLSYVENLEKSHFRKLPQYRLYSFVNKYKILKIFCSYLYTIEGKINDSSNLSKLVYYFPYLLLFLSFIYDLVLFGKIYYFYIFLLLVIITNFIKKIRYFYERKNYFYDNKIAQYIYINEKDILNNKTRELKYELEKYFNNNHEELIEYLKNDFTRDILIKLKFDIYYGNKRTKRLLIIFLFLLASYFSFYYNKFIVIIFNYNMNLSLFFLFLVIILYIVHRKIFFYNINKNPGERFFPKWLFRIIVIIFGFLSLYVLLINKVILYPKEIIFDIEDIIKIEEVFSENEKNFYIIKNIEIRKKYV